MKRILDLELDKTKLTETVKVLEEKLEERTDALQAALKESNKLKRELEKLHGKQSAPAVQSNSLNVRSSTNLCFFIHSRICLCVFVVVDE